MVKSVCSSYTYAHKTKRFIVILQIVFVDILLDIKVVPKISLPWINIEAIIKCIVINVFVLRSLDTTRNNLRKASFQSNEAR